MRNDADAYTNTCSEEEVFRSDLREAAEGETLARAVHKQCRAGPDGDIRFVAPRAAISIGNDVARNNSA